MAENGPCREHAVPAGNHRFYSLGAGGDTMEATYIRHGGILPYILRSNLASVPLNFERSKTAVFSRVR